MIIHLNLSNVQRSYSQELFDNCIKVLLKNAITPKVGIRVIANTIVPFAKSKIRL